MAAAASDSPINFSVRRVVNVVQQHPAQLCRTHSIHWQNRLGQILGMCWANYICRSRDPERERRRREDVILCNFAPSIVVVETRDVVVGLEALAWVPPWEGSFVISDDGQRRQDEASLAKLRSRASLNYLYIGCRWQRRVTRGNCVWFWRDSYWCGRKIRRQMLWIWVWEGIRLIVCSSWVLDLGC